MSHLYCYSFEGNDWSREYPGQEEIRDYLMSVAHKYRLYNHIRFNSAVEAAQWDERTLTWTTTVRRTGGKELEIGETYQISSDFLVAATGQLSRPKYPDIKDLEKFGGKIMHSARWDHSYDLSGKKVGILGTGASAAQIIPEIAKPCQSLTIFQRSPAWVVPRHDRPISQVRRNLYKYFPPARVQYRKSIMDERESKFEPSFFPESSKHHHVKQLCHAHRLSQLPGEVNAELRAKVTPDYPFSCKRIIVSDDLYPTMRQEHVNLETRAIKSAGPSGLELHDGESHDLDVLVCATGYHSTEFLADIKVIGSDGSPLHSSWGKTGASAYLGMTVPSLPNFGILYGPGTNLAYNSLIIQIEAQSLYVSRLINAVLSAKRSGKTLRIEPKKDIADRFNRDLQSKLSVSTFADTRCSSWFKDEKGRIINNWGGSAVEYQKRVECLDWSDFDVLGTAAEDVMKQGILKWNRRKEEGALSKVQLGIMGSGLLSLTLLGIWLRLA